MIEREFWRDRRVLVTGHTGFKGGWLSAWLTEMGAEATGYSLDPPLALSCFGVCGLERRMRSIAGDVRQKSRLREEVAARAPEVIFHLAAQSLVRRSYREPALTFETNVIGTVNLLDAALATPSARALVVVTSDKCYADDATMRPHREDDALGGRDPYSASKAAAEMAVAAWRGLPPTDGARCAVASARAGNVIGGGDWAQDRLVPDAIRSLSRGDPLTVRNPGAIRPWQHVLEPLSGYLVLAQRLYREGARWASAWNFGPDPRAVTTVAELADRLVALWGSGSWRAAPAAGAPHERHALMVDPSKAAEHLGWRPRLGLDRALAMTVNWYRAALEDQSAARDLTLSQIDEYERLTNSGEAGAQAPAR